MAATYNGYTVLSLKFNENCTETYIFLKKHNVRDQSSATPKDRTLFIQGLPPYTTKELLKPVFEKFGKVHKIILHTKLNVKLEDKEKGTSNYFGEKPKGGFKVGYIVFQNESSVRKVLEHPVSESLLLTSFKDKNQLNIGLNSWKLEYNASQVDETEMKKEIDEYMTAWDEKKAREDEEEKNKPGEEGWEVVTHLESLRKKFEEDKQKIDVLKKSRRFKPF
ncbi:ribosomal RNA-processing protein 7 homolog A [Diaphorina citri]|uniref:Ribosomal RNA-processing protein 7 homolog A n=1 Tax=Diaphorina citri TaxID=121845 RepID=A0A1S4EFF7_DIACI|nr:ribosomal RNA-processing protein 7 homolog A [Diaphorina citri]